MEMRFNYQNMNIASMDFAFLWELSLASLGLLQRSCLVLDYRQLFHVSSISSSLLISVISPDTTKRTFHGPGGWSDDVNCTKWSFVDLVIA